MNAVSKPAKNPNMLSEYKSTVAGIRALLECLRTDAEERGHLQVLERVCLLLLLISVPVVERPDDHVLSQLPRGRRDFEACLGKRLPICGDRIAMPPPSQGTSSRIRRHETKAVEKVKESSGTRWKSSGEKKEPNDSTTSSS